VLHLVVQLLIQPVNINPLLEAVQKETDLLISAFRVYFERTQYTGVSQLTAREMRSSETDRSSRNVGKNYHYLLRNNSEERSSHLLRGSSQKSPNLQPVNVCRTTQAYLQDVQLQTEPKSTARLTALCFSYIRLYNLAHD